MNITPQRSKIIRIPGLETHFSSWQTVIDSGELGHIFFLPVGDIFQRIQQFLQWQKEHNYVQSTLIEIPLTTDLDSERTIAKLKKTKADSFLILPGENVHIGHTELLLTIHDLLRRDHIPFLLFHYIPIDREEEYLLGHYPPKYTEFFQNIYEFPLYQKYQVKFFLQDYSKLWNISFSEEEIDTIFDFCGGYIWLLKEVLRERMATNADIQTIFQSRSFLWKCSQLWSYYSPEVRASLHRCIFSGERNEFIKTLERFQVISQEYTHHIPGFLFQRLMESIESACSISKDKILYNGVDCTNFFSAQERTLLEVLDKQKNKFISREELGSKVWREEVDGAFSDWALDQSIYRLRKKLASLHLPKIIKTKKNVGYTLE